MQGRQTASVVTAAAAEAAEAGQQLLQSASLRASHKGTDHVLVCQTKQLKFPVPVLIFPASPGWVILVVALCYSYMAAVAVSVNV